MGVTAPAQLRARHAAQDLELLAVPGTGAYPVHHPEVLGEAIQTVIRAEIVAGRSSISDPYDVVKQLTRGKAITKDTLREFVSGLDIGQGAKERLLELTPESYTGLASELVDYLDS